MRTRTGTDPVPRLGVMTDLVRRSGPVSRVRVAEHDATGEHAREDVVAAEEPLEIRLAWPGSPAQRAWVTMRTPGHDFELAAGWVVHEGLVSLPALAGVAYCTDVDLAPEQEFNVVTVTASERVDLQHRHAGLSSGSSACGVCGKDSIDAVLTTVRGPRWEGPPPDPERRTPPPGAAARGPGRVRPDRWRPRGRAVLRRR